MAVRHEIVNTGSAPVSPQLYLQLVRDGNKPPGESSFYSTFTGPAVYTEAKKYQKIEFKDIEKNKADFVKKSHQRLRGDGAALLRQRLDAGRRHGARHLRAQGRHQPLRGRHDRAARTPSRRAPARPSTREFFVGPQEEKMLEAHGARAWNWSRTTAGSPSWPSRCTGCSTSCTACSATGAGRSWRWWCCSR